jgi:hypothetical protein
MKIFKVNALIILLCSSCLHSHDSPDPQASSSVDESLKKGVYNYRLDLSSDRITVNNSTIHITDIWKEDTWFHGNGRSVATNGNKQIIIRINPPDALEEFSSEWSMGVPGSNSGISNGNIRIRLGEDSLKAYTIYVYKYQEKYNIRSKIVIDSLKAFRRFK